MDNESERNIRLNEVVEPFRKTKPDGYNPTVFTAFDTTRPNFHDSKADFLKEKELVETAIGNSQGLYFFLLRGAFGDAEHENVEKRIASIVEERSRARLRDHPVTGPDDVVRKNASEIGLPRATARLLWDFRFELQDRMRELESQESTFWSLGSRPPNYYARTIAIRFAKFVARESGQKPTIGTSSDGNHPSTDYGRALEEIFEILGIKSHFKRPGQWAIDELTEKDFDQV